MTREEIKDELFYALNQVEEQGYITRHSSFDEINECSDEILSYADVNAQDVNEEIWEECVNEWRN